MPVERRGRAIAFEIGSTGNGRNPMFNGRRQPSRGGTSRMIKHPLLPSSRRPVIARRPLQVNAGGRRSYFEARPDVVALTKELSAAGMSLRKISAALAERGHLTGGGKPYVASAVQAMLAV